MKIHVFGALTQFRVQVPFGFLKRQGFDITDPKGIFYVAIERGKALMLYPIKSDKPLIEAKKELKNDMRMHETVLNDFFSGLKDGKIFIAESSGSETKPNCSEMKELSSFIVDLVETKLVETNEAIMGVLENANKTTALDSLRALQSYISELINETKDNKYYKIAEENKYG